MFHSGYITNKQPQLQTLRRNRTGLVRSELLKLMMIITWNFFSVLFKKYKHLSRWKRVLHETQKANKRVCVWGKHQEVKTCFLLTPPPDSDVWTYRQDASTRHTRPPTVWTASLQQEIPSSCITLVTFVLHLKIYRWKFIDLHKLTRDWVPLLLCTKGRQRVSLREREALLNNSRLSSLKLGTSSLPLQHSTMVR